MAIDPVVIKSLRLKIDEPDSTTWSDEDLQDLLDQADGSEDAAAVIVWESKAASYSQLVNVSESGSSRSMGDLQKNALAMQALFTKKVADAQEPVTETAVPTTRTAVRK